MGRSLVGTPNSIKTYTKKNTTVAYNLFIALYPLSFNERKLFSVSNSTHKSEYLLNQDRILLPQHNNGKSLHVAAKSTPPKVVTNQGLSDYSVRCGCQNCNIQYVGKSASMGLTQDKI